MKLKLAAFLAADVFLLISGYAIYKSGLATGLTIMTSPEPWELQMMADIVIGFSFAIAWMVQDAKKLGRSATPFIVLTLLTGGLGPLLYVATRKSAAKTADRYQEKPAPA